MTNFEKIKKMGIRQLAEYLANLVDCDDCWAVFQRKNDNVITCQMTEQQARNYKKFRRIEIENEAL